MMSRTKLTVASTVLLLAAACAHESGPTTTTVTGGSLPGVRVTSARASDESAMRLADEICAREAACNHIGVSARYRSEEACMAEQGALAPSQIARWSCVPAATQAGFEQCLAAVRSERCETPLDRVDALAACRSAPVCAIDPR
jgi:hypothetical protein